MFTIAFCLCIFLLNTKAQIEQNQTVNSEDVDNYIVFGRVAFPNEYPWVAALHVKRRFTCTSFIISPTFIATAAHCVVRGRRAADPRQVTAIIGSILRDGPGQRVQISKVTSHSRYGINNNHDIAVLRTTEPMTFSDRVKAICLSSAVRSYAGIWASSMGWGRLATNLPSSLLLLTTPLLVTEHGYCKSVFSIFRIPVTEDHLCAGGHISGVCNGDSGSPLVAMVDSTPVAIGITSFGTALGCAVLAIPDVFTSVGRHVDWITEHTGGGDSKICIV